MMQRILLLGLLVLLTLGCSLLSFANEADQDICQDVWCADVGSEIYCWHFWQAEDGLTGSVYTIRDNKKQTELPISRIVWQAPNLEAYLDKTGIAYKGTVDFKKGTIDGGIHFEGAPESEMDLVRTSLAKVPGLLPRLTTSAAYNWRQPLETNDDWQTTDLESAGISEDAVVSLVNAICAGEAGLIHSLVLAKGDKLIVDEYFHGYGRQDVHRLASVTKSVSSLLVGLAIDRGDIANVSEPVLKYFPNLKQPESDLWQQQTLHHLLSMSMGLDWGNEDPHETGPAGFSAVFERPVAHEPGTFWAYQNANVNLLAGVLKKATGQHADDYAERFLFKPLNIKDYDWDYLAADGYRLMDGSLHLRPRDMAKLGLLIRNEGLWRGKQVLSKEWMRESTGKQILTDGPEEYGYLWWIGYLPTANGPVKTIFANGHGSQFIGYVPDYDLTFVVTGGNEDNGHHFTIGMLIANYLL